MFITLTGMPGSGKSNVCEILKASYGFEIFTTGTIMREFASKNGLSIQEFNTRLADNNSFNGINVDEFIDSESRKYAKKNKGKKIVFDSRLAWHFVGKSLKVFLDVDPNEAARRVSSTRISETETYSTIREAFEKLLSRKKDEDERFKNIYGVDCSDLTNFDLVIDTTSIPAVNVARIIMEKYEAVTKK